MAADRFNPPTEMDFPTGRFGARKEHLLAEISARPRRSRRLRRGGGGSAWSRRYLPRLAGAAVVVALAASLTAVGISISGDGGPQIGALQQAEAAIDVVAVDGNYEIRFVELAEDTTTVEAELQRLGLDIRIDFVPVSPSLEGRLVASESSERAGEVWEYTDPDGFGGPAAVNVPSDFSGSLALVIGRPAEQGEPFQSTAISAQMPGETLHCVPVEGKTVREALPLIEDRGVTVEWWDQETGMRHTGTPPSDMLDMHITGTTPLSDRSVLIPLASEPPADSRTEEFQTHQSQGCPS